MSGGGSRTAQAEDDEWIDDGPAWTFPRRAVRARSSASGAATLTGLSISERSPAASEGFICRPAGSRIPGPIYVPEGASDVAALISVGQCAVGRPGATGGVGRLARLLRDMDRRIIVLGENDQKPDGRWPGKEGAETVTRALAEALGRQVEKGFPPAGYKDVRDFISSRRINNLEA